MTKRNYLSSQTLTDNVEVIGCIPRDNGRYSTWLKSTIFHPQGRHDIFAKDAPDSFRAKSLKAQFAANAYLSMSSEGGALQIWKDGLSPEEFDAMRGDSYGIEPSWPGEPAREIQPVAGDLLIFNSRCMHSVTAGIDDLRLSLSCFIGHRGTENSLSFWS
ncbi:2OG-Fe(II) oxygenase [Xenorhabdus sp. SF857]|uniref:2OG-Fe(II) oxygenase n=1 Tax=Xenorhabdus bakwenae TaxID=3026967 RepID=UPI002557FEEB|nr:2OG-Fe(II) oxygenase [Xenorhabdus sp. SF857]WFQ81120.1 2OG-Fe(II) oxygenase [Xenorhabdus sp. SF857]